MNENTLLEHIAAAREANQRADLRGADLSKANLHRIDLESGDLSEANLREANLRDANLEDASLRGADLRGADLTDAHLVGADLRGANLREVNLHHAFLEEANLAGADLRDANLPDTYLIGANLQGADLRGADLSNASLNFADLRGADLRGAYLSQANLTCAKLDQANLSEVDLSQVVETGYLIDDPRAVSANRRGEITPPQRFTLRRQHLELLRSRSWVLLLLFVPLLLSQDIVGFAFLSWPIGILLVGSISLYYYRKILDFQQSMGRPKIEQGIGQLVHGPKGYQIQLSNRRLPLDYNRGELLPGATYRIYYLPKSAFVLSAEKVEDADESQAKEGLLNILAQAIGFSMEALAANRQGRLKISQYLLKFEPNYLLSLPLSLVFSFIASLIVNALLWEVTSSNYFLFQLSLAALTASFFLVSQLLFWFLPLIIEMTGGLHHFGRVQSVEGIVRGKTEQTGGKGGLGYRYQINGELYLVTQGAYDALIDGLRYRVYYLPRSKSVVSIEPLESPKEVTNGGVVIAD